MLECADQSVASLGIDIGMCTGTRAEMLHPCALSHTYCSSYFLFLAGLNVHAISFFGWLECTSQRSKVGFVFTLIQHQCNPPQWVALYCLGD